MKPFESTRIEPLIKPGRVSRFFHRFPMLITCAVQALLIFASYVADYLLSGKILKLDNPAVIIVALIIYGILIFGVPALLAAFAWLIPGWRKARFKIRFAWAGLSFAGVYISMIALVWSGILGWLWERFE